jgi:hypothetical protein
MLAGELLPSIALRRFEAQLSTEFSRSIIMMDALSKPVLDRIRRYAKQGRELHARYGQDCCLLVAVAAGQTPVVILRSARDQFTELRKAAIVEWMRAGRLKCN